MATIKALKARQILDSRGNPTVEVDLTLSDGSFGRASVPSGASTGEHEAHELRDGGPKYCGKGVLKAVQNVQAIAKAIDGKQADQADIDRLMIELDGTDNKSRLGANAMLAVSMALARASASSDSMPLFEYIAKLSGQAYRMPVPMVNIWNGGSHAGWATDIQEYMLMPVGAKDFPEAIRMCSEVFQTLKKIISKHGYATTVGDEGGFAPTNVKGNEEPLEWMTKAVEEAGYAKDIRFALDPASSSFFDKAYLFNYKARPDGAVKKTSAEMIDFYRELAGKYPIISIEDGLDENDWDGWVELTKALGGKLQLVGDDLYVTNPERLKKGIGMKATNSILIKLNQIGSLTETLETMALARKSGMTSVVSHRSGETEDPFISHLVVGTGAGQIKTGSVCRGERTAKYNELLRIAEALGDKAPYPGESFR